jgi:hypothetical protein
LAPSPLLEEIRDGQETAETRSTLVPPLDRRRLGSIRSRSQRCGRGLGSLLIGPGWLVDPESYRLHDDLNEPSRHKLYAEHLDDHLGCS